jgi:SPP1 family predicted phage head-tail adaptor
MARLEARDLDRRITILRTVAAPSGPFNEPPGAAWLTLAEVDAKVVDASAGESYRAAEVGSQITARFTVRWSPTVADVNPRDRIRWRGRDYDITAARDVGRRKWRELDAVARAEGA